MDQSFSEDLLRMQILEMIDAGRISAEEGIRLLATLQVEETNDLLMLENKGSEPESVQTAQFASAQPSHENTVKPPPLHTEDEKTSAEGNWRGQTHKPLPELNCRPRWWLVPLWAGTLITTAGGALMFYALQTSGLGLWLICAIIPFFFGLGVIGLALQNRDAPWLYLNIQQRPGKVPARIKLSIPLPIRPAAWLLRRFGKRIHGIDIKPYGDILLALEYQISPNNPFYLEVQESQDCEKVEILIG